MRAKEYVQFKWHFNFLKLISIRFSLYMRIRKTFSGTLFVQLLGGIIFTSMSLFQFQEVIFNSKRHFNLLEFAKEFYIYFEIASTGDHEHRYVLFDCFKYCNHQLVQFVFLLLCMPHCYPKLSQVFGRFIRVQLVRVAG